jgi:hypothetical protein
VAATDLDHPIEKNGSHGRIDLTVSLGEIESVRVVFLFGLAHVSQQLELIIHFQNITNRGDTLGGRGTQTPA